MAARKLHLLKRCAEWLHRDSAGDLPPGIRGVYALLRSRPRLRKYDVVYIGMATGSGGIRKRLKGHTKRKSKWTHFSLFEVRREVSRQVVAELEGLLREIYRKDTRANRINKYGRYQKLQNVRENDLSRW